MLMKIYKKKDYVSLSVGFFIGCLVTLVIVKLLPPKSKDLLYFNQKEKPKKPDFWIEKTADIDVWLLSHDFYSLTEEQIMKRLDDAYNCLLFMEPENAARTVNAIHNGPGHIKLGEKKHSLIMSFAERSWKLLKEKYGIDHL
jgi:hypothetical protein